MHLRELGAGWGGAFEALRTTDPCVVFLDLINSFSLKMIKNVVFALLTNLWFCSDFQLPFQFDFLAFELSA